MAPAPQQNSSVAALAGGLAAIGVWRLMAVATPHLGTLILMLRTETDFGSRLCFLLAWGILNFLFIALLRRPALSGALSLTLVVVLVLLSRFKHDVVQMTANFVDLMVIDRDTAAFLLTIFPNLRWSIIGAGLVTLPLMYALWWLDPFRIRRLPPPRPPALPAPPRSRATPSPGRMKPGAAITTTAICRNSRAPA
ncbi:hypothetical protein ACVWY2_003587 [Bradyrhizobium sp. JR6.1]